MKSLIGGVLGGIAFGACGYWTGAFIASHSTQRAPDSISRKAALPDPGEKESSNQDLTKHVDTVPPNDSDKALGLIAQWFASGKNIDDPRFRLLLRRAIESGDGQVWPTLRQLTRGFNHTAKDQLVRQAILATKPYLTSDYIYRSAGWNDQTPAIGQLLMQVSTVHDLDALSREVSGNKNRELTLEAISTAPIGDSWLNTADFVSRQNVSDVELSRLVDMTIHNWTDANSDEAFVWLNEHSTDPRFDPARVTFSAILASRNTKQGSSIISAIKDQRSRAIAEGLQSLQ